MNQSELFSNSLYTDQIQISFAITSLQLLASVLRLHSLRELCLA
jgi:hypothetical protein